MAPRALKTSLRHRRRRAHPRGGPGGSSTRWVWWRAALAIGLVWTAQSAQPGISSSAEAADNSGNAAATASEAGVPALTTVGELLARRPEGQRVRLRGTVVAAATNQAGVMAVLRSDGVWFTARLPVDPRSTTSLALTADTEVEVTGVASWGDGLGLPGSFDLELRTPADVKTVERLIHLGPGTVVRGAVGIALATTVLSVWVTVLRRKVRRHAENLQRQMEAQTALQQRYLDLVNESRDLIYSHDLEARFLSVNPALTRQLGYDAEELRRLRLPDLLPPEQRESVQQWLTEVADGRSTAARELTVRAADGSWRTVEANPRLVAQPGRPAEIHCIARDITDRKQAEEALRQSEERFRALIEKSEDLIVVLDDQMMIRFASPAMTQILGHPVDGVIGHNARDFMPDENLAAITTRFDHLVARPGSSDVFELRLRHRDGTRRLFECVARNLLDLPSVRGVVINAHHVTERRRAEEELRKSLQTSRDIIRFMPAGIFLYRHELPDRLVLEGGNSEAERLTGLKLSESVEREFNELWPGAAATGLTELFLNVMRTGQVYRSEEVPYQDMRMNGAFRVHAFPLPNQRLAVTFEDITHRKRLEEDLRQMQKLEAIGLLAGGVAHDFNNNLTAIQLGVSMAARQAGVPEKAAGYLRLAESACWRAATLTRQLLTFGRRQPLQLKPVGPNQVVSGLAKMLARVIGEDIELVCELQPELPVIRGDAGMLEQVLLNLAVNARDAMPSGGRLEVRTSLAVLDGSTTPGRTGRFVCVAVHDTGSGIPPEVLPHIFEPFFTTKQQRHRAGLGLAMAYSILQQHGGWVDVETEVGQGTTFRVYLPVSDAVPCPEAPGREAPAVQGGSETLLVVEDDDSLREVVRAVLQTRGYRVVEAHNGSEALEIWERRRQEIDLLFTDLVMPGTVNGRDLARRLLADRPALPVIYTTGYSIQANDLVVGRDCLPKPYDPDALARLVRERLDTRSTVPENPAASAAPPTKARRAGPAPGTVPRQADIPGLDLS